MPVNSEKWGKVMSDEVKIHRPSEQKYQGVSVTDSAHKYFVEQLKKHSDNLGVRLYVKTSGCSGYLYQLDFVDDAEPDDIVFDIDDDLRIYVDKKSLTYVDGTELDYIQEGLNSKIAYRNPRAQGICGCGESFSVEND